MFKTLKEQKFDQYFEAVSLRQNNIEPLHYSLSKWNLSSFFQVKMKKT